MPFSSIYLHTPTSSPPCSQLEEHAAKAHDVLALKCRGVKTVLNYEGNIYEPLLPVLPLLSRVRG